MKRNQSGATVVEFALVLLVFFVFLLGLLDFARMLFTWNAANEATRAGARYAVVCDNTARNTAVLTQMQGMLPQITTIDLAWDPPGCNHENCEGVTVTITGLEYQWISPLPGLMGSMAIPMPSFSTYLPREIMRQDPHSDAIC